MQCAWQRSCLLSNILLSCGVESFESRGSEVVCDQWRSDVHRLQRLVDIDPETGNLSVIIPGTGKCGGTSSTRVYDIALIVARVGR